MHRELGGPHKQQLALTLRRLRTERNLSQSEVARATGISNSFLSLVEQGRSDITIGRLLRLARFYDLKLTDLVGSDGDPDPDPVQMLRADPEHMIHSDAEKVDVFDLTAGTQWTLVPVLSVYQPGGAVRLNDPKEHETLLFVLAGTFEIQFASRETARLKAGNGVIYCGIAAYHITNVSNRAGRILAVGLRSPRSSVQ